MKKVATTNSVVLFVMKERRLQEREKNTQMRQSAVRIQSRRDQFLTRSTTGWMGASAQATRIAAHWSAAAWEKMNKLFWKIETFQLQMSLKVFAASRTSTSTSSLPSFSLSSWGSSSAVP